jgi:hypothetical protein
MRPAAFFAHLKLALPPGDALEQCETRRSFRTIKPQNKNLLLHKDLDLKPPRTIELPP